MTKIRGIKYLSYNRTDYCPKCGMWGIHEIWQSYLTRVYTVGSVKHTDMICGKSFTIKRCWY
jgi:hypothetical protein